MSTPIDKDELLVAVVETPQAGQLLAAVSLRLPYASAPSTVLIDVAAVSAATCAILTSALSSRSTAKRASNLSVPLSVVMPSPVCFTQIVNVSKQVPA